MTTRNAEKMIRMGFIELNQMSDRKIRLNRTGESDLERIRSGAVNVEDARFYDLLTRWEPENNSRKILINISTVKSFEEISSEGEEFSSHGTIFTPPCIVEVTLEDGKKLICFDSISSIKSNLKKQ